MSSNHSDPGPSSGRYVQSMSGQLAKDVRPGRSDDMYLGPSEQARSPEPGGSDLVARGQGIVPLGGLNGHGIPVDDPIGR